MSAALFQRLAEIEAAHLSRDVREWVTAAYADWLNGETLERAYRLDCAHGQRKPATQERMRARDGLLRAAWALTPGDCAAAKADSLAKRIKRIGPVYRRFQQGHIPSGEINDPAASCGVLGDTPNSSD